jgi:group II intron reverse transcriptase/maturase
VGQVAKRVSGDEVCDMQDAETTLAIIQERGRKGLHLEDVYRRLYNPDLYFRAFGRIHRDPGARTKRTTEETVDGMALEQIGAIIEAIRSERHRWTPVRRAFSPETRRTTRPPGIPTWTDKLLQEVVRSILEAYYEPQFSEHSHGFRPGRGCHTALRTIRRVWKGTKWFIKGEIKECFDKIDRTVLLSILREKIHDNRFLRLLENLLKAGYLEAWNDDPTRSGRPQRGILGPILANIYLDRLDRFVETTLIPEYTRGASRKRNAEYRRVESQLQRLRRRGVEPDEGRLENPRSIPRPDLFDPVYRSLRFVRYAADFFMGFGGPRGEAEEIKERLTTFLRDDLKLELSSDKTMIFHARQQPARFLGYEVSVITRDSRRSLNGRVALRMPTDVLMEKAAEYKYRGKPSYRREWTGDTDFSIVARYGSELRGFAQYYKLAQNLFWADYLRWVMKTSLLKTLALKHRSTVAQMARKYVTSSMTPNGARKCVEVVVQREGKSDLVARFGDISLKHDDDAVFDDGPTWTPGSMRKEHVPRLRADRCELCGSTHDIRAEHVRKLTGRNTTERKDFLPGKQVMSAGTRTTRFVCHHCHAALRAGKPTRTPHSLVSATGEPDEAKASRPVRRGVDGKGVLQGTTSPASYPMPID